MTKLPKIVFFDGQNIFQSLNQIEHNTDYKNLSLYLKKRFKPEVMYWFVKYTKNPNIINFYTELENCGWTIAYSSSNKDIYDKDGNFVGSKCNVDGDLIVKSLVEYYENGEYELVIGSGDGDFVPLVRIFEQKNIDVFIYSATRETTAGMIKFDRYTKKDRKNRVMYLNETNFEQ